MSVGVRLLLGALAVDGGADSTHHRSASFWSDLDDGSSVPKGAESASPSALPRLCSAELQPRATAAATQGRRAGCCCSSTPAAAARGSGTSRCRTSPKAPPPTPFPGFRTGAGERPPCPSAAHASHLVDPRRVRSLRLKLFPPEYVSILYCTPAGWTPGGKGYARVACTADSEYHVLVPSEAWSGLLSGRGTTCPYPQPPAGLAKDHIRVALTAQGVRYAVLAQVGTLEATPAFRLSAAGLHERLSSTVVAGGPEAPEGE